MWNSLQRYWTHFGHIKNKVGLFKALLFSFKRLWQKSIGVGVKSAPNAIDPVQFYNFVFSQEFGQQPEKKVDKQINWVIPDFGIGSGGHLNIFRIVKKFEERGYVCRIIIDGTTHFLNGDDARKVIRKHFFEIEAEVAIGREGLRPAIATFATGWTTAYTVRDYIASGKKFYFVQDFEPYFYALGSEYVFAENTYRFGFKGITAGSWLSNTLCKKYGMDAISFKFSYDRELYKPHQRREPATKRVFFYARPVTQRRAFELGLLTLTRLYEKQPDVEFVLAGWDLSGYKIPFPFLNAGVVSLNELPDLYSQCDVALVLSLTNLSLLPLEVMACGCTVVSNRGENVEWLLTDEVAKLSELEPEMLSNTILSLLNDEDELSRLKQIGLDFVDSTNWEDEVDKIVNEIEKDLVS